MMEHKVYNIIDILEYFSIIQARRSFSQSPEKGEAASVSLAWPSELGV
jgi:hypothetical protein